MPVLLPYSAAGWTGQGIIVKPSAKVPSLIALTAPPGQNGPDEWTIACQQPIGVACERTANTVWATVVRVMP